MPTIQKIPKTQMATGNRIFGAGSYGLSTQAGGVNPSQIPMPQGIPLNTATGFGQAQMINAQTTRNLGNTIGRIGLAIDQQNEVNEKASLVAQGNTLEQLTKQLSTIKDKTARATFIKDVYDPAFDNYGKGVRDSLIPIVNATKDSLRSQRKVVETGFLQAETTSQAMVNVAQLGDALPNAVDLPDFYRRKTDYESSVMHIENSPLYSAEMKFRLRNTYNSVVDSAIKGLSKNRIMRHLSNSELQDFSTFRENFINRKKYYDKNNPELSALEDLLASNLTDAEQGKLLQDAFNQKVMDVSAQNTQHDNNVKQWERANAGFTHETFVKPMRKKLNELSTLSQKRMFVENELGKIATSATYTDVEKTVYKKELNRLMNSHLAIARDSLGQNQTLVTGVFMGLGEDLYNDKPFARAFATAPNREELNKVTEAFTLALGGKGISRDMALGLIPQAQIKREQDAYKSSQVKEMLATAKGRVPMWTAVGANAYVENEKQKILGWVNDPDMTLGQWTEKYKKYVEDRTVKPPPKPKTPPGGAGGGQVKRGNKVKKINNKFVLSGEPDKDPEEPKVPDTSYTDKAIDPKIEKLFEDEKDKEWDKYLGSKIKPDENMENNLTDFNEKVINDATQTEDPDKQHIAEYVLQATKNNPSVIYNYTTEENTKIVKKFIDDKMPKDKFSTSDRIKAADTMFKYLDDLRSGNRSDFIEAKKHDNVNRKKIAKREHDKKSMVGKLFSHTTFGLPSLTKFGPLGEWDEKAKSMFNITVEGMKGVVKGLEKKFGIKANEIANPYGKLLSESLSWYFGAEPEAAEITSKPTKLDTIHVVGEKDDSSDKRVAIKPLIEPGTVFDAQQAFDFQVKQDVDDLDLPTMVKADGTPIVKPRALNYEDQLNQSIANVQITKDWDKESIGMLCGQKKAYDKINNDKGLIPVGFVSDHKSSQGVGSRAIAVSKSFMDEPRFANVLGTLGLDNQYIQYNGGRELGHTEGSMHHAEGKAALDIHPHKEFNEKIQELIDSEPPIIKLIGKTSDGKTAYNWNGLFLLDEREAGNHWHLDNGPIDFKDRGVAKKKGNK